MNKLPPNISIYSLLDYLHSLGPEFSYKLIGNVAIALGQNDFLKVHYANSQIVAIMNSISILGVQGALPMYYIDEANKRAQIEDFVLQDFLNLFNHKIAELAYQIRRSLHIKYYSYHDLSAILSNFIVHSDLRMHKLGRISLLSDIIESFLGPIRVEMQQNANRLVFIQRPQSRLRAKLGGLILGRRLFINDRLLIYIKCTNLNQYQSILINKLSLLECMLAKICSTIKIKVELDPKFNQKTQLGRARLGQGMCL